MVLNKLKEVFNNSSKKLNIYFTAGFPYIDSTIHIMQALEKEKVDIIEIGIPYSDPVADGPIIQESNAIALCNGMNISLLFDQLKTISSCYTIPIILMGYLNPILQYGIENFCSQMKELNISGCIIPDLPTQEFDKKYKKLFQKNNICFILLVTPESIDTRIQYIDKLSSGFLYAVTSSSPTGGSPSMDFVTQYLKRLHALNLTNPILAGFGIKSKEDTSVLFPYCNGVIVGSAYIQKILKANDIDIATKEFIQSLR